MAYFLVSYELKEEQGAFDYRRLWEEFDRLGAVRTLRNEYLLDLNHTAQEVVDHLRPYLQPDDHLMVVEFSKKPAFAGAIKGTSAWLAERFEPAAESRIRP